jgi:release factor glutamine methyltransferase
VTLRQSWKHARGQLTALPDIDNPELESEILLRYALRISRAQFYLDLDQGLTAAQEKTCREFIDRRLHGEPAAYITGTREFFGLDFMVDQRVLIPRPETELLVEEAIKTVGAECHSLWKIADIGTGSGAIAVSLAIHLRNVNIIATDISANALAVAAVNCRTHGVFQRIELRQGDLLEPLPDKVDILIANLPYVTTAELAEMPSSKYEPRLALDGGAQGLDLIFRLIPQLGGKIKPGGLALMEIGLGQSQAVTNRLREFYPVAQIAAMQDLAGIDRVVKIQF